MNDIYPLDIWHAILQHCDFLSQIRLISACSNFYHSLFITDIYDIPCVYTLLLTDSILRQQKFSKLVKLDVRYNTNIRDISFLTHLKKLSIYDSKCIDQDSIDTLDLIELCIVNNHKIKDISFMSNLKRLDISKSSEIDQDGIRKLNPVELHVSNNHKIKDISFMSNLKKLSIYTIQGLDQNSIQKLDPYELNIGGNLKIKDISFMSN